jgi:hypothetical protein
MSKCTKPTLTDRHFFCITTRKDIFQSENNPALQCGAKTQSAGRRHRVWSSEPRTSVRGGKMVCGEETWSAE